MKQQPPKAPGGAGHVTLLTGLAVAFAIVALVPPPTFRAARADAAPRDQPAPPPERFVPMPTGGVQAPVVHPADEAPVNPPIPDLSNACPAGWTDLGRFKLTAYVLAIESEFDPERSITNPCGLSGSYRTDFLFSTKANPGGVMMQGSGRTLDGRIVHYVERDGRHCFEELSCARTASQTCAEAGRTVAVDRRMIPLGADLLIEGVGARVAEDTGGRVSGRHIDVYRGDELTLAAAQLETRFGKRVCVRRP